MRENNRAEAIRGLANLIAEAEEEQITYDVIHRSVDNRNYLTLINKRDGRPSSYDAVQYNNLVEILRSKRTHTSLKIAYYLEANRDRVFASLSISEQRDLQKECQDYINQIIASNDLALPLVLEVISSWFEKLRSRVK